MMAFGQGVNVEGLAVSLLGVIQHVAQRQRRTTLEAGDLLITLEGGAMHVSAAVDTPTLAIFGSTSDVVWAPWGEKNITLRGGDHANSVKAEQVIEAAGRMLMTQ